VQLCDICVTCWWSGWRPWVLAGAAPARLWQWWLSNRWQRRAGGCNLITTVDTYRMNTNHAYSHLVCCCVFGTCHTAL
jgi:hypothetical protein